MATLTALSRLRPDWIPEHSSFTRALSRRTSCAVPLLNWLLEEGCWPEWTQVTVEVVGMRVPVCIRAASTAAALRVETCKGCALSRAVAACHID